MITRALPVALMLALAFAHGGCRKKQSGGGQGGARLAVGHGHACLLRADHSVWCWGSNALGSVGVKSPHPSQQYQATAVQVKVPAAKQIAIASVQTCFEAEAGGFFCWGGGLSDNDASPAQLSILGSNRLIGGLAPCVLDAAGTATCWGENTNSRLAPGDREAVAGTDGQKIPPRGLNVGTPLRGIAVGDRHSCALASDGRVLCWGLNNFGQLGEAGIPHRAEPRAIDGLSGMTQIVSGSFHSCALDGKGSVWCWGRGDDGELGTGELKPASEFSDKRFSATPTKLEDLSEVRALAASGSNTCAITADDELFCWGNNEHGQLGDGTADDRHHPIAVKGLKNVAEVGIGFSHVCARVADDVYCWGDGHDGRLGNGSIEDRTSPVQVRFGTERVGPDVSKLPLTEHESLACGFRVELPGERIYQELRDTTVEYIGVASKPPSRFVARCSLLSKMADKTPADLEKRLAADGPGEKFSRRSIDGVECLDVRPEKSAVSGGSIFCFTRDHFVDLTALSEDGKRAEEVLASLHFFDPKTAVKAAEAGPPAAPAGMVAVPAGEFAMGCANQSLFDKPIGDLGCTERSQPLHRVHLRAYAIDTNEVSIAEYDGCVAAGKCRAVEGADVPRINREPDKPATFVDWEQANSYCVSKGKRLPTEAEWEKAARGTDGRTRPWGEGRGSCEQAALLSCSGPTKVGTHAAGKSPYGALDMAGNVKEWVADRFGIQYFLNSPRENPQGPEQAAQRTVKGSSYMTGAGSEAVHWRQGQPPSFRDAELGFRCAQSLEPDPQKSAKSRCGCRTPGERNPGNGPWFFSIAAVLTAAVRRRSPRDRSAPQSAACGSPPSTASTVPVT